MCSWRYPLLKGDGEPPVHSISGRNEVDTLLYPHKVPQNGSWEAHRLSGWARSQRDRPKAALWLVGRHVSSLGSSGNRRLAVKLGESRAWTIASFFCWDPQLTY